MGSVTSAYPASYLATHDVFNDQIKDRQKALATAKALRKDGYKVKVTIICPFGEYIWCIEGKRKK